MPTDKPDNPPERHFQLRSTSLCGADAEWRASAGCGITKHRRRAADDLDDCERQLQRGDVG